MDGVRIFSQEELEEKLGKRYYEDKEKVGQMVKKDMEVILEGMTRQLFGNVGMRWMEEHFPFTYLSNELEIQFKEKWLEVLGCGVIQPKILSDCGINPELVHGWAFGIHLLFFFLSPIC